MIEVEDIPQPDQVDGSPHPRMTSHLYGQSIAEAAFLEAFNSNRLHHAWLISGPRGVGKATLAWRIARFLLDQPLETAALFGAPSTPDALDVDPTSTVQRHVTALSESRLFLCRRPWDDKLERLKQDITVDEVRRLKSFFNFSSADGGRRVVIVDAADEMNKNAANALLKILEEPPARVTMLLVSHRPLSLLPTIRSRCRTLACHALAPDDLAAALAGAGFETSTNPTALSVLAAGSVGEAIRLISHDGLKLYATLIDLLETGKMDRPTAIHLAESCTSKAGAARYDVAIRLIGVLMHRIASAGVFGPPKIAVSPAEASLLTRLAPSVHAARGWADLAQTLSERAAHARAVNLDPASVILDMLLKIDQMAATSRAA